MVKFVIHKILQTSSKAIIPHDNTKGDNKRVKPGIHFSWEYLNRSCTNDTI